jgi:N6-L-threonylcarbamoyladenine synthase
MNILAIETSCDESSVALLSGDTVTQLTASQIDVHKVTGGVVPEVAAREHVPVMIPFVQQVLAKANLQPHQIDRIAVTAGPGLITSLLVGVETARALAYGWQKPIFPTNHIEGHIAANFLVHKDIPFPALALVVSGGHTELLYMPKPGVYELVGATRDDAAGECFDKCARVLGLPYPGGPAISKLAKTGDPLAYSFPSPLANQPTFDFSFSGLKTAVLYFHRDHPDAKLEDVCAGVQEAIVNSLHIKTQKAVEQYKAKSVLVGGGVAANPLLRERLNTLSVPVFVPPFEYCTDNAAMIAAACRLHDTPTELFAFRADPAWELTPR